MILRDNKLLYENAKKQTKKKTQKIQDKSLQRNEAN